MNPNEELISFDIKSLYTNVPLNEAINYCTNLLFSGKYETPPVDQDTFRKLVELCSCNVVMLTNDGYYTQVDGLAMGSPPAPQLANGWLSKFDNEIKGNAKLYTRYMDDILREIEASEIERKLQEINNLHSSLSFTIERENDSSLPFLDMSIKRMEGKLSSIWYTKPTDTGLTMNYHALAPQRYKRSVVVGLVHRIYNSCSTWQNFNESLSKGKVILEKNQYPPSYFEPIIAKTLSKIIEKYNKVPLEKEDEDPKIEKKMLFIQYRGKVSEKFEQSLLRINAPCKVVFTIRKLKTKLPSLKPKVQDCFKSGSVYKIECPRCNSCYVGQTSRHVITRIKEHIKNGPVGNHFSQCNCQLSMYNVSLLYSSSRNVFHLMTLEALMIKDIKPCLNKKDEYRSRELVIKI